MNESEMFDGNGVLKTEIVVNLKIKNKTHRPGTFPRVHKEGKLSYLAPGCGQNTLSEAIFEKWCSFRRIKQMKRGSTMQNNDVLGNWFSYTRHMSTHNIDVEETRSASSFQHGSDLELQGESTVKDGGWGWMIVLSSFMVYFILGGIDRSSGVLYLIFEEKFQASAAITAWIPAMATSLKYFLSPLAVVLCSIFPHRLVVIFSGIILAVTTILSACAENVLVVFICYGVVGGIAQAMAYTPSVVVVNNYFERKLSTAMGLSTFGVGVGAVTLPLLLEIMFKHYGYFGNLLLLSGLFLQLIICGATMRPFSQHKKLNSLEKKRKQSIVDTVDGMLYQQKNRSPSSDDVSQTRSKGISEQRRTCTCNFIHRCTLLRKFCDGCRNKRSKTAKFSLLKDSRYCAFCVAILFFTLANQNVFTFLPAFAKQIGLSEVNATYTVVIAAACDAVNRVIFGFLFDFKCIRRWRVYIYNVLILGIGLLSFTIPFSNNFMQLGFICACYGILVGLYISQKIVIIADLLGQEKLSTAIGILLFFQGIGSFAGPPISGLIKDNVGTYEYAFYIGAGGILFETVLFLITNILYYLRTHS